MLEAVASDPPVSDGQYDQPQRRFAAAQPMLLGKPAPSRPGWRLHGGPTPTRRGARRGRCPRGGRWNLVAQEIPGVFLRGMEEAYPGGVSAGAFQPVRPNLYFLL